MLILKALSPIRNIMKIWIFFYYFVILIFLSNKIESVNKKLQKSFDEIFGEGWEEKEQNANANWEDGHGDQRDGIGQCQAIVLQTDQNNNYLDQTNEEPNDQNENEDQSDEIDQQKIKVIQKFRAIKEKIKQKGIKYPRNEWIKIDCIIAKKLGTNRIEIYKWIRKYGMKIISNKTKIQKSQMVIKFDEMKNEFKQKRKYSTKEWRQNYAEIAKKVGVCHTTIKRWRKELGMGAKKITDDHQKREIICKFRAIKEKIWKRGIKWSENERNKIEEAIAKKLGTSRRTVYNWIRQFGMGIKKKTDKIYSEEQKFEKVKQFIAICNEYKQKGKRSQKERDRNYKEISKKLGVCYGTIKKWKKEFGMDKKYYKNEEKMEIMEQYWGMKRDNPKISDREIAKSVQIAKTNFMRWKSEIRE